jgi:hypothetical protein
VPRISGRVVKSCMGDPSLNSTSLTNLAYSGVDFANVFGSRR